MQNYYHYARVMEVVVFRAGEYDHLLVDFVCALANRAFLVTLNKVRFVLLWVKSVATFLNFLLLDA